MDQGSVGAMKERLASVEPKIKELQAELDKIRTEVAREEERIAGLKRTRRG